MSDNQNQNEPQIEVVSYQKEFVEFTKKQKISNRRQDAQIKAIHASIAIQKKLVGIAVFLAAVSIGLQIYSKEKPMPPELQSMIESIAVACIVGSGGALLGGATTHPQTSEINNDELSESEES